MEDRGLTQAELARLVGTTRQQIYRFATGQLRISPEWAEKMAPHLGVRWQDIFDRAAKKEPARQTVPHTRRVVQIASVKASFLVALCDDGTIWFTTSPDGPWKPFSLPPGAKPSHE